MENTGVDNIGNRNIGNRNIGNRNSGNRNSGYWNSGNRNSGNWNIGNRNSGDWNSGNWNSGDMNSGNWNSGDRNSGYFNTDEPKVRIFGKETDVSRNDLVFPSFFYFNLTEWISELDMTKEQKDLEENQYYKTTGGIFVTYKYKEAFQKSYESLSKKEKKRQTEQLKALPNFDKDIFFQISGIMIEDEVIEELKEKIVTDETGKKYKLVPID